MHQDATRLFSQKKSRPCVLSCVERLPSSNSDSYQNLGPQPSSSPRATWFKVTSPSASSLKRTSFKTYSKSTWSRQCGVSLYTDSTHIRHYPPIKYFQTWSLHVSKHFNHTSIGVDIIIASKGWCFYMLHCHERVERDSKTESNFYCAFSASVVVSWEDVKNRRKRRPRKGFFKACVLPWLLAFLGIPRII